MEQVMMSPLKWGL